MTDLPPVLTVTIPHRRPILAIDPGTSRTGWVLLARNGTPLTHGKTDNLELLTLFRQGLVLGPYPHPDVAVIEWTQPRGMLASLDLFEAFWYAGRFAEALERIDLRVDRLQRDDVKRHLCGTRAAKDSMIRQAIIDRYGGVGGKAAAVGVKALPGPLYGVKADAWAALAVGLTWIDREAGRD